MYSGISELQQPLSPYSQSTLSKVTSSLNKYVETIVSKEANFRLASTTSSNLTRTTRFSFLQVNHQTIEQDHLKDLPRFGLEAITVNPLRRKSHLAHTTKMKETIPRKKVVVAITGATGAQIGIHILQTLRRLNVETHLIISKWAAETIKYETDYTPSAVKALADHAYSAHDLAAPIASGSYRVDGMIVAPCSVKTLAAINAGAEKAGAICAGDAVQ
ncbi:3-octaprenyl-4-hydroxybenzoate carboxy-lyase [Colletotrichum tofieldiae]|uniref:3-octaprenyl-4-hydroxybenzoate carboxy-lyase n=1 Tax=Colletotrichum tofieldiae TaxID=708197 RepID=A0A161W0M8_9PEZI|nr:3-octaprenyl-4-hydroxybenzoate carboxy-lyase [Colletotrichum tofieldiae]